MVSVDLGCGNNKISPFFVGVDINKEAPVDYVSDIENLSVFSDSSINVVFCRRCLQHIPNDTQALREINRILTKDGIAVIEVASTLNSFFSKTLNALKIKTYTYKTFHVYTEKQLKERIQKAGLKIIRFGFAYTKSGFENYLVILTKGNEAT